MPEDTNANAKKKIAIEKLQNLQKTVIKLIKQMTFTEKSKKIGQQVKLRALSDINSLLHQIQRINSIQIELFADEKLIIFVRHFLIDNFNNKIAPLQFFRIILVSEAVAQKFIIHSIPIYISRILERDDISRVKASFNSNFQEQLFEALRLIKHWIDRFPKRFPQYLAFSLTALAQLPVAMSIQQKRKDQIPQHIKIFCIDILLAMSAKNTKLCCICGGFNVLINSITEPAIQQKSYDIISKMLIFLNDSKNRDLTLPYIDFKKVFHVITDLDNVFLEQSYKTKNNLQMLSKFQNKLSLAKNAIVTMLKSWVGLIYIGNDPSVINSLLETLKEIPKKYDSEVRNIIFQALQQIVTVGDHVLTASTAEQKHSFKVSNLIGCYLMTVIQLFIQQNLLRILIQLSGVQQSFISEPSQKLLKRLTLLIFNYRPESSKHIDFLITAAKKTDSNSNSEMLKTSSSFVINKIGNYIYDRKQKKNHPMFNDLQNLFSLKTIFVPHSRASLNSISKTLNFISYKQKNEYRKNLLEKDPISKQYKQNYIKWKWDIIENLLQFPDPDKFKPSTNERYRQNKMYKYLLRFFSPSRGTFFKLDWHMVNFIYVKVGMLLVKNSITILQNLPLIKNPPQSQFECTVSFIGDLEKLLQINITECLKNSVQWNIVLCTKLQRQLISFIGLFSQTKIGYETLICENRFFQLLQGCLHLEQCSHLIYLILINLDFYRDDINKVVIKNLQNGTINILYFPVGFQATPNPMTVILQSTKIGARHLLQMSIKQGSNSLKLSCLEILKILLKSEVYMFSIFAYRLIIYFLQVQNEGTQVIQIVVEFLQDNLTNKNNVQIFLKVLSDLIVDFDPRPAQINFNKNNSDSSEEKMGQNIPLSPQKKQKQHEDILYKNLSFYSQGTKTVIGSSQTIPGGSENKLKFQQIKQKLTTPIIIRLLSYDFGIQLVQKYFPDWLEQEYQKWMSSDHNYCAILQNKLNSALNFTKKKQKGYYKIASNSHAYDLLFMFKLPWILHANQQKFPLWIRQKGQSYQLYANFGPDNQKQGRSKLIINNDNLKIMLGIGTMLVDEEFNFISSAQNNAPLTIFLAMNPKKVNLFGQKLLMVESNGVEIYYRNYDSGFDKNNLKDKKTEMSEQQQWQYYTNHVQDLNKLQIMRIVINVKLPIIQHTQQLPLHLINELTKTKKGREFLHQKKYIKNVHSVLINFMKCLDPQPTLLQVRSALWSLGFYGSRNEGIKLLHQTQILDIIIKMTFTSPTLSLRGTCRYILNMFSHSEYGRNILVENGFNVNSRCFTTYPVDIKKFYSINWSPTNKRHFILDNKYWQSYTSMIKPMSKNEQKLFQLISLLINSLSFKSAVTQIRQILKASPKTANSVTLLQNVVNLLTFFKYKHQSRKSILNIFDQILKSPEFNNDVGNKIIYFISQQQISGKISFEVMPKSQSNLSQLKLPNGDQQIIRTEQNLKF